MKATIKQLLLITMLVALGGCMATGKYTNPAPETNYVIPADKSAIVFMRASAFGGAITSPLLKVDDEGNTEMVGILGPEEKMVYYTEPGENTFMIIGENADFIQANLEAGKAYYAIIRPRMGFWKARFSLTPFKANPAKAEFNVNGEKIKEWSNACTYTVPNAKAESWHQSKKAELAGMYHEYMLRWQGKSDSDKELLTLSPEDGLNSIQF